VINHFSGHDVCKAYHVFVKNVQVHWIKNSDDLFLKRFLYRIEHAEGEHSFFLGVYGCAELCRRSLVQNCERTPWGCWVGPYDWAIFAGWCDNGV
jgi:hypothetical protein